MSLAEIFDKYGWPGLVVVVLALVVLYLYRVEIKSVRQQLADSNAARLQDAKDHAAALMEQSNKTILTIETFRDALLRNNNDRRA